METVKLNSTVISGGGLKYAITPQIVLGNPENGYEPGTILDANQIKSLNVGGGTSNSLVDSVISQSYSADNKTENINNAAITLTTIKSNANVYSGPSDIISGYNIASLGNTSILCGFGILNNGEQNLIIANAYILKIKSVSGDIAVTAYNSTSSVYKYLKSYDVYMIVGKYANGLKLEGEKFSKSTLKKVTFDVNSDDNVIITNAIECGLTKPGVISLFTTSNDGKCSILAGENRGNYTNSIAVGT
jgi:hypothetical protein|nr:MAG TPA: hypothetical protein [Crassvirales sp.]